MIWGVSRAGRWLIANGARLQAVYMQASAWLEGHGLYAAGLLAQQFNLVWLIRVFQDVISGLRSILSFALVTLIFVLLGLLEVEVSRRNWIRSRAARSVKSPEGRRRHRHEVPEIHARPQPDERHDRRARFGFAYIVGLDLALEWGVIAFALNYIPFIGPFIATVLPTLFAIAQFKSWQMGVVVFLGLNLIQFVVGSYFERRIAGSALAISPFMVLFAVFFWSFLWGLSGAFIGVPILIAFASFCEQHPSSRWMAHLLSGGDRASDRSMRRAAASSIVDMASDYSKFRRRPAYA